MLLTYLNNLPVFPEYTAKFLFRQVLHAVEYMHSSSVAHLDLKLENIMLDEFFNIRVGDFGSSFDYHDQTSPMTDESVLTPSNSSSISSFGEISLVSSNEEIGESPRCYSRRGTFAYMAPEVKDL